MYIVENVEAFGNRAGTAIVYTRAVKCAGALQLMLNLSATDADTLSACQLQVSEKDAPAAGLSTADWLDAGTIASPLVNLKIEGAVITTAMNAAGGLQQVVASSSTTSPFVAWKWARWVLTVGANQVDALTAKTRAFFPARPETLVGSASGLFA